MKQGKKTIKIFQKIIDHRCVRIGIWRKFLCFIRFIIWSAVLLLSALVVSLTCAVVILFSTFLFSGKYSSCSIPWYMHVLKCILLLNGTSPQKLIVAIGDGNKIKSGLVPNNIQFSQYEVNGELRINIYILFNQLNCYYQLGLCHSLVLL